MRVDLTDWATMLEVLDGARAPFTALSVLAATLAEEGAEQAAMPPPAPPVPNPRRRRRITWRLVP